MCIALERNLARKSQCKQNLERSQQILQDYILPCKKAQALARVQNFLQDFDFKNLAYQDIYLAYQDISKILQVLQELAANLQDLATNLQDGFNEAKVRHMNPKIFQA